MYRRTRTVILFQINLMSSFYEIVEPSQTSLFYFEEIMAIIGSVRPHMSPMQFRETCLMLQDALGDLVEDSTSSSERTSFSSYTSDYTPSEGDDWVAHDDDSAAYDNDSDRWTDMAYDSASEFEAPNIESQYAANYSYWTGQENIDPDLMDSE